MTAELRDSLAQVQELLDRSEKAVKVLATMCDTAGLRAGAQVARELLEDMKCLKS